MTRPRILLTRRWPEAVQAHLAVHYDLTVNRDNRPLDGAALGQAMQTFDVLCPTVTDQIDVQVLETRGATVRLIANYGAGTDHIDLKAAAAAGISVTNTPDVLTEATAELAILLMLMVSRRAGEGERELRAGAWTGWRPTHLMGRSLTGLTLGLVGFGRIARATGRRAQAAFGMKILYHARREATEPFPGAIYHPDLATLLTQADVVSLHCPGGSATRHLIDAARLALMKRDAILINTARGSVIEEAALAVALGERRIAGAGLDVFEDEPRVTSALLAHGNAVLLPHLGSATQEARTAMGMRVAANLDAFFAGRPLPDKID